MGWFDSLWSSDKKSDPLGKLDPALKEFLEKESPVKYHLYDKKKDASVPPSKKTPDSSSSAAEAPSSEKPTATQEPPSTPSKPKVPPESLFPDGRYAHIWSTYRPLGEIEAETKTDNEKLQDVLDGYKERKHRIAQAAIENCAEEQWAWRTCMTENHLRAKATLCSREVKKFERCYGVNSRLLKTLGYLETFNRSPTTEEDIQIHAYDIYQTMLAQERAIAEARKANQPIPTFPALIPRKSDAEENEYISTLPPAEQDSLRRKLDLAVSDSARAQIFELHKQVYKEGQELSVGIEEWRKEQERKRQERIREGQAGIMDKVMGLWNGVAKGEGKGDGGGGGGSDEDHKK